MRLYFVRHGQTNSNAGIASSRSSAVNDEPLNELGIQQANELAEQLKNEKFDLIISSPFKRALQTAEIVNKYHNLDINIDPAWQEMKTDGYVNSHVWNDLLDFDKSTTHANTENLADFLKRIYEATDKLVAKNSGKNVLVVSHGGVQHALYAYANKLPLTGNMRINPMKNCECRVYELGS